MSIPHMLRSLLTSQPVDQIVEATLDKLIEDVVLDEDLADAVKTHVAKGSASTP